jgi:hypothetical protein
LEGSVRGYVILFQSPEFASAKAAAASADQIVALRRHPEGMTTAQLSEIPGVCDRTVRLIVLAMLIASSRRQIEIHNLTGEEI